jgi:hypothetical protein
MVAFIDVEKAIGALLGDLGEVGTAVPAEIPDPYICVQRVPGSGSNGQGWQDVALVEVQTWAKTRPESVALNTVIRGRLAGARAVETPQGLIDRIREAGPPTQLPYADEQLRWVPSTWQVTSRIQ